ncbi:uncharacterized protein [Primulina huaijiensis]|uniref:uncharacterized protein n=1 Tax=Primulina huaijiensis TaxID=1492673 RepID=UPI003CC75B8F
MDFVIHLSLSSKNCDVIWVVVDRLTKSAHFVPYSREYSFDRMARLYIQENLKYHAVPTSIVSDRDPRFTSRFWGSFQKALGTTLSLSTAYHPETDGERQVQGPELVQQAIYVVELIKKRIKTAQDRQSCYANTKRRPLQFMPWEKVFLKVSPFRRMMRFGLKGKLAPRFIILFEILECVGNLTYRLALPSYLSSIHNIFHVSLLRRNVEDESHVFDPTDVQL